MARVCKITKKKPMHGNRRSHAMNATKRWFVPNVHYRRLWSINQKRFVTVKVSAKGMRMVDKLGVDYFLSGGIDTRNSNRD